MARKRQEQSEHVAQPEQKQPEGGPADGPEVAQAESAAEASDPQGARAAYHVVVRPTADGYVASAPEFSGCEASGSTRAEALDQFEQELDAQLRNMTEQGVQPPVPAAAQSFDGTLSTTVSAELHRELAIAARLAQVDLRTYLAELLARSVGLRMIGRRESGPRQDRAPRGGNERGRRRGPSGQRYHDIMENRADFIEYVRSLDAPPAGGSGGPPGRGRGGRGRRR